LKVNGKSVQNNVIPDPAMDAGMFLCGRTHDGDILRKFYHIPRIWSAMKCDGSPDAKEIDFDELASANHGDSCIFVTVSMFGELAGLFMFHQTTTSCYDIHSALLPDFWGRGVAHDIGKAACVWMVENTDCTKITTSVPEFNAHARRMAMRAGMRIEGCNRSSFLKGGVLYDQLLFGFTKEELLCQ
jgi:RimJ/RimL family protein N-acetyltransferase